MKKPSSGSLPLRTQKLGNILDSKSLRCPDLKDKQFEAPLFIPDIGEPFSFEAFEINRGEGRILGDNGQPLEEASFILSQGWSEEWEEGKTSGSSSMETTSP